MSRTYLLVLMVISVMTGRITAQSSLLGVPVYHIYVGTLPEGEELSQFSDLHSLGTVRVESPSQGPLKALTRSAEITTVFLGSYLDQQTAEHILSYVHQLGYQDAYIEPTRLQLRDKQPESLYTIQLGAFSQPRFEVFTRFENVFAFGMFTQREDGLLKISAGLYPESELSYVRREVIPWLRNQGYQPFLRKL